MNAWEVEEDEEQGFGFVNSHTWFSKFSNWKFMVNEFGKKLFIGNINWVDNKAKFKCNLHMNRPKYNLCTSSSQETI
jgi:hypothetical protein